MKEKNQRTVLLMTAAYFLVELLGGLHYKSLALVTDASFMGLNITGQLIVYYVSRLSKKLPDKDKTFGYERAKVLSGLFNGMLVGFLIFYVLLEAYGNIKHPQPLEAGKVLLIALLGLFVNAFGLIKLSKHLSDINLKGASLLFLNDTLGSVGVISSSLIIIFTRLWFVDAVTSVIISLLAAYPTYFLIKDSVHILMEGKPARLDVDEVKNFIYGNSQEISSIKDVHIWGLSPEKVILAVRIRTKGALHSRSMIKTLKNDLKKKFDFFDIYVESYEEKWAGEGEPGGR